MPQPSNIPAHESLTPAAFHACKRLVQHIHRHRIGPGDSLAPQQQLREELKLTNDALSRAMSWMCERKALVRRPRMGTRVLDLSPLSSLRWTVGLANIAAPAVGPLSVFTSLSHQLQVGFARIGWDVQTFYRFINKPQNAPRLEEFDRLGQALAQRQLDGLVLLTTLLPEQWRQVESAGVPTCHAPFWEKAPCSVAIDLQGMSHSAIRELASQGCKRLAAVMDALAGRVFTRHLEGIRLGLADAKLPASACPMLATNQSVEGGHELAQQLLAMPADKRPDGLIVYDDYIALGLTQWLRAHQDRVGQARAYRPRLAVLMHHELHHIYHLPVLAFEVTLQHITDQVIQIMQQRVPNPCAPAVRLWAQPTLRQGDLMLAAASHSNLD